MGRGCSNLIHFFLEERVCNKLGGREAGRRDGGCSINGKSVGTRLYALVPK